MTIGKNFIERVPGVHDEAATDRKARAYCGARTTGEKAYVERFMRTLKGEEVHLHEYEDLKNTRAQIAHFLNLVYRYKRVRSALGDLPPAEFEAQWLAHPVL